MRWVRVRDLEGTVAAATDEYLFGTDPAMTPERIVEAFTARWCIKAMFQEANAHLGLATPRVAAATCEWSVLRTTPCLLGLFSVVSLIAAAHARRHPGAVRIAARPWYATAEPTFADAFACVRLLLWRHTILATPRAGRSLNKAAPAFQRTLLAAVAHAA